MTAPARPGPGYVPVGGGIGASVLWDGRLNVVAGSLFAQIERERADGPRYVEALRGGRLLRYLGFCRIDDRSFGGHALPDELRFGIPAPGPERG